VVLALRLVPALLPLSQPRPPLGLVVVVLLDQVALLGAGCCAGAQ
jgi:hypothetical protein